MKKRILSLMLALIMVLSMFPGLTVLAAEAKPTIKIESYTAENGEIHVGMNKDTTFDVFYTITNPNDADAAYDVWWRIARNNSAKVVGKVTDVAVSGNSTYYGQLTVTIPAGMDISDANQLRLHLKPTNSKVNTTDFAYNVVYTENKFVSGYTVTLHNNGGMYNGSTADPDFFVDPTLSYGSVEWPLVDGSQYSRPGYAILGYASDPDATAAEYTINELKQLNWETSAKILDWYAVWERREFNIAVEANAGGTVDVADVAVYGDTVPLTITPAEGFKVSKAQLVYDGTTEDLMGKTSFVMPETNAKVVVEFTRLTTPVGPAQGAAYFVEYYAEELDGTYTQIATDVLGGAVGSNVTANSKKYLDATRHLDAAASTLEGTVIFNRAENPVEALLTLKVYYALNEYTVEFDADGGTEVEDQTVKHGAAAVEPTAPERIDRVFRGWYLGDEAYDFSTPVTGDITLKARWAIRVSYDPSTAVPKDRFVDVTGGDAYYDAVEWAAENGITMGVSATEFDPDAFCTRAQAVTFLWRAAGCPKAENADMPFTDVAQGVWYYDAVLWAVENGVVKGISATEFAPDVTVTLEQMTAILWRFAKSRNIDVSVGEETNILSYNDAFDVTEYAIPAMQWACGSGMVSGTEDDKGGMLLEPQSNTTRARVITMLVRLLTNK